MYERAGRPFKSTEEHDKTLIDNWNSLVGEKDFVIHLGDFCWARKPEDMREYCSKLKGRIIFIRGNHDKFADKCKDLFFSYHEGEYLFQLDRKKYFLSHFPHLAWPNSYDGKIYHFFGHIHSGPYSTSLEKDLPIRPYSLDIGQDAQNYHPILLQDAIAKATPKNAIQ